MWSSSRDHRRVIQDARNSLPLDRRDLDSKRVLPERIPNHDPKDILHPLNVDLPGIILEGIQLLPQLLPLRIRRQGTHTESQWTIHDTDLLLAFLVLNFELTRAYVKNAGDNPGQYVWLVGTGHIWVGCYHGGVHH